MLNTKLLDVDSGISRYEFEKLSDDVQKVTIEVEKGAISQRHTEENIKEINSNIKVILERSIRQDTIFSLIYKVWKISPYIIGFIFFITLWISETSFDLSKFMISFLEKILGT